MLVPGIYVGRLSLINCWNYATTKEFPRSYPTYTFSDGQSHVTAYNQYVHTNTAHYHGHQSDEKACCDGKSTCLLVHFPPTVSMTTTLKWLTGNDRLRSSQRASEAHRGGRSVTRYLTLVF